MSLSLRILELEVRNFRPLVEGRVSFGDGVNFVHGPNGAGKTSLLEALAYSLYGSEWVKKTKMKYSELVTLGKGEGFVRLRLEVGGKLCEVRRTFTRSGCVREGTYLVCDGRLVARGDVDVTKALTSLMGIDVNLFHELVYVRQGELRDIYVSGRESVRIDRLLRIDLLEKLAQSVLKSLEKSIAEKLGRVEGALAEVRREETSLLKNVEMFRSKLVERRNRMDALKAELDRIRGVKDEYDRLKEERDRMLKMLVEEEEQLKLLLERRSTAVAEEAKMREKLASLEAAEGRISEYQELERRLLELKAMEEAIRRAYDLRRELRRVEEEIDRLRGKLERLGVSSIEEVEGKAVKLREELEEVSHKVRILEVVLGGKFGGRCPVCGRELSESEVEELRRMRSAEYEEAKRLRSRLVEELRSLEGLRLKLLELSARIMEALNRRRAIERELNELPHVENPEVELAGVRAEISSIERRLGELEYLRSLIQERDSIERKLDEVERVLKSIDMRIEEVRGRVERLREEVSAIGRRLEELKPLVKEYERLQEEYARIEGEVVEISSSLSSMEKRLAEVRERMTELERERERLARAKARAISMRDAVERARPEVRRLFLDLLNEELNDVFLSFRHKSDFVGVRVDPDYKIYVVKSNGVSVPLDMLSLGEKNLLAIALRYAMAKLVLGRIPLFILDEPTEHLDAEHRSRIADWITTLADCQVILTSHIDDFVNVANVVIDVRANERGESYAFNRFPAGEVWGIPTPSSSS